MIAFNAEIRSDIDGKIQWQINFIAGHGHYRDAESAYLLNVAKTLNEAVKTIESHKITE